MDHDTVILRLTLFVGAKGKDLKNKKVGLSICIGFVCQQ
jgi:hypothetical protein